MEGSVKPVYLSVRQYGIFLRNWSLGFPYLLVTSLLAEHFFPGKFIFAQIWAKKIQNGLKIGLFGFEKFCYFFLEII